MCFEWLKSSVTFRMESFPGEVGNVIFAVFDLWLFKNGNWNRLKTPLIHKKAISRFIWKLSEVKWFTRSKMHFHLISLLLPASLPLASLCFAVSTSLFASQLGDIVTQTAVHLRDCHGATATLYDYQPFKSRVPWKSFLDPQKVGNWEGIKIWVIAVSRFRSF